MSLIERDIMVLLADGKLHSANEIGSYAGLGRERTIDWCDRLCREGKLEKGFKEVFCLFADFLLVRFKNCVRVIEPYNNAVFNGSDYCFVGDYVVGDVIIYFKNSRGFVFCKEIIIRLPAGVFRVKIRNVFLNFRNKFRPKGCRKNI